jgi:transposase
MDKEHQMVRAQLLKTQGYKQYQIAEMLGVTDRTVRNYLKQPVVPRKIPARKSKLDGFKLFIDSIISENPYFNCIILYERLKAQGYTGRISIMRYYVAKIRKRIITEAVIRFETEPGRQAQVDWKEYRRIMPDGTSEKVYAFVMILGYSRKPFVLFTKSMKQGVLHACHTKAFEYFGYVPHEILYDNMRTAFVVDSEGNWHPNKRLLLFANHYGYLPKRCQIYRPQTKGKVERAINYLNTNFWPQVKDDVWNLDALNETAHKWCGQICQNLLRDFQETRAQRFEHEKGYLKPLPEIRYDFRDTHEPIVSRESLVTFETNRYSVPPEFIGLHLTLKVDPLEGVAEILDGTKSIRVFKLEKNGSRKKIFTPEDEAAIMKLWTAQKEDRMRKLERKQKVKAVQTETRSPASYDQFSKSEEVA